MNQFKEVEQQEKKERNRTGSKNKKSRLIRQLLSGEFLTRDGLINHLPFIGFLVFLFLFHISLMYYFERIQLNTARMRSELNEVRSAYNTAMSELERKRQQSSVATDIASIGLKELRTPPNIIEVQQGFLRKDE